MSSIGGLWIAKENISPVKHNAKDWFIGTGAQIAALPSAQEHNFAKCTVSGSNFVANVCYYRNAAGSAWLPFFPKHKHGEDTAEEGGSLFEITLANIKNNYELNYDNLMTGMMISEKTAGATYDDVNTGADKYVQLGTTTGVNSYSTAKAGGLSNGWDARSAYYVKQGISHNTDILMRSGASMNHLANAADSRNQYGFEQCTGDGVNVQLVTANLSARTKTSSGFSPPANTPRGYAAIHTPGVSVVFKTSVNAGSIVMTKTTNIPSSGFGTPDDTIVAGTRTTNTTIKTLRLWAVVFAGKIFDNNWVPS